MFTFHNGGISCYLFYRLNDLRRHIIAMELRHFLMVEYRVAEYRDHKYKITFALLVSICSSPGFDTVRATSTSVRDGKLNPTAQSYSTNGLLLKPLLSIPSPLR
jgi:hypothetical protein